MTAIITDKLKNQLAQQIFDEATGTKIGDSDNYFYVAVGRSETWEDEDAPDTPNPVERDERLFRYNVQALKAVEAFSFVTPLKDWTSGNQYAQYSDASTGQEADYYVRTEDNNVYLCLRSGKDSLTGVIQNSTVKPDHTDTSLPTESDGYIWKYLYTITTADGNSFLTANWMPVKFVDSALATDPYFSQYQIHLAAVPGQIVGYRVVEAGTDYSNGTTDITIVGDGNNALARLIVNANGAIQAVEVGDSTNASFLNSMGSGYTKANIKLSGGTGGEIAPVFGPKEGLGNNPIKDFRTSALMFNIKPEGNVSGKWIVDNQYRQIALWKNPLQYNSASKFTGTEGTALPKINLTDPETISFSEDVYAVQSATDAKGVIDYAEDSTIWYHQNEVTGFDSFEAGSTISISSSLTGSPPQAGLSALNISSFTNPEIDIFSGDILYINNTTDVPREVDGSEDIKLIVKL